MTLADIAETDRTGMPGPKGSMMKLLVTATHKALGEVVSEILGWDFLEFDGDRSAHPWTYEYLWSWVFSISGGTNEIQREITADRVLELPRARLWAGRPKPIRAASRRAGAPSWPRAIGRRAIGSTRRWSISPASPSRPIRTISIRSKASGG
jgi:hypothetical protein